MGTAFNCSYSSWSQMVTTNSCQGLFSMEDCPDGLRVKVGLVYRAVGAGAMDPNLATPWGNSRRKRTAHIWAEHSTQHIVSSQ
jgi:hypothetical protein